MHPALTRPPRRISILAWPILLLALALFAAPPAQGHPGKGKGKGHKNKEKVRVVFVPVQQTRIREYFVVHRSNLPGYYYDDLDDLPPGIRKQLILNGTLPPGLEKRIHPFPVGLDDVLGPPPPNYRRVVIGRDAYLVDTATNIIVDILTNAISR